MKGGGLMTTAVEVRAMRSLTVVTSVLGLQPTQSGACVTPPTHARIHEHLQGMCIA